MKKLLLALLLWSGALAGASAQQVTQCVSNAQAGGTVNAITIPLLPCGLATNLLLLTVQGTNTASAPTLQMTGFPAQPLRDSTGGVLGAGALPPAGGVVLLTSTGTQWRILAAGGIGTSAGYTSVTTVAGASYNALITDQFLLVKNSPAQAISIVLPAKSNWPNCPSIPQSCPTVRVKDGDGNFSSGAATITTADGTLLDQSSSFAMGFDGQEQSFTLNGTTWSVQ